MKILLDDGNQLNIATGIGSYARYLSRALATLPDTAVTGEDHTPSGRRVWGRLKYLWYLNSAAYQKKLADFDAVHYVNYAMPRKHPKGTVVAVTVHDLASFSQKKTLPRAYAAYNRFMVRRALKRADVVFTVSHAMRNEILARFPHARKRIVAVYPGHYTASTADKIPALYENEALTGLEKRKFFLYLGTVEARKNVTELVRAYNLLVQSYPAARDFSLVLAGRRGFGADAVVKQVLNAPDTADIRLAGFVSDSDRQKLLGEAAALVFPSLYEGFGSPQTEAMAAGLPLILSDIPTNREVSGAYGSYYPVGDESTLAALLKKAVENKLHADPELARTHLARYDWQTSAAEIRAALAAAQKQK